MPFQILTAHKQTIYFECLEKKKMKQKIYRITRARNENKQLEHNSWYDGRWRPQLKLRDDWDMNGIRIHMCDVEVLKLNSIDFFIDKIVTKMPI